MRRPRQRTRHHQKPSRLPLVAENRKPEVITRKPYESLKRIRWYRHYPDCLTRAMRVAYPGMVMRLAFQPESAGLVYGGKNAMATYVHLFNFTEQGLRNIKDTVKRAEALKKGVFWIFSG